MACVAVETLKRALTQSGPSVLQSMAFDHYDSDTGKAVNRRGFKRLARVGGRRAQSRAALDIIIYAANLPFSPAPRPSGTQGMASSTSFWDCNPRWVGEP